MFSMENHITFHEMLTVKIVRLKKAEYFDVQCVGCPKGCY